MPRFCCWAGSEGWNETGREIEAKTEKEAARLFAERHCRDFEAAWDPYELLVFVAPADRPHRHPSAWPISVEVEEEEEVITHRDVVVSHKEAIAL